MRAEFAWYGRTWPMDQHVGAPVVMVEYLSREVKKVANFLAEDRCC